MPRPLPRFPRPAAVLLAALLVGPAAAQEPPKTAPAAAALAKARRADLQKKLAAGTDLQKRFRIDAFEANADDQVEVRGVLLLPGFDKTPLKENEKPDPADAAVEAEFKKFQGEMLEFLRAELKTGDAIKYAVPEAGITRLGLADHPAVALQNAANVAAAGADAAAKKPEADQVMLTGAAFDGAGTLVLIGTRGEGDAVRDWLTTAAATTLAKNPAAVRDGKFAAPDLGGAKAGPWGPAPRKLQEVLAASGDRVLEQVRIDRVYPAYDTATRDPKTARPNLRLVLEGVTFRPLEDDHKSRMREACKALWPDQAVGEFGDRFNKMRVDDPSPTLQEAVAGWRALDGVRVDAGAKFGPDGRLVLAGVRPAGPPGPVEAELGKCFAAAVGKRAAEYEAGGDARAAAARGLAAGPGVSAAAMTPVDTRKVLAEMQKWVAQNLDEVKLSRVYFGTDGGVKYECFATRPADEKAVLARLRELIRKELPDLGDDLKPKGTSDSPPKGGRKEVRRGGGLSVPVAARQERPTPDEPKKEPQAKNPDFQPAVSLVDRLVREVEAAKAKEPKAWAGLFVERGFFNPDNSFTLVGAVESAAQKQKLTDLVQSLKSDPALAPYFAAPVRLEFPVLPMAALVERVRRVMPAYEVFDGIRVTGADYRYAEDAEKRLRGRLVFAAHVVGRPARGAEQHLTDLIAADRDRFNHRLPKDRVAGKAGAAMVPRAVEFERVPELPADDQLAHLGTGYGAAALAKGDAPKAKAWVDAALLHYPNEAAVWFLSAYQNHLAGDRELARRDLYRVIELEGRLEYDGPAQRKRRYAAAKDLQGGKRDELEKLWLECWREVKDGAGPITVAEPTK